MTFKVTKTFNVCTNGPRCGDCLFLRPDNYDSNDLSGPDGCTCILFNDGWVIDDGQFDGDNYLGPERLEECLEAERKSKQRR